MKRQRLIALFVVGLLVFNYPVLSLFSVEGFVLGIPVLYLYIFSSWGGFVWLLSRIVEAPVAAATPRPDAASTTPPTD